MGWASTSGHHPVSLRHLWPTHERDYNRQSALACDYVWAGGAPVAQIDHWLPLGNMLQLAHCSVGSDGKIDWVTCLHTDGLSAPRIGTDVAQNVVWRWDGEAFGETAPNQTVPAGAYPVYVNLRNPGQYFDQESSLFYNRARYYNPQTGRYISSDSVGLLGGLNTYTYANGSPANYADPSGQCPWCVAAGVGAAIGGVAGFVNGLQNNETVGQAFFDGLAGALAGATAGLTAPEAGLVAIGAVAAAGGTAISGLINGTFSWTDVGISAASGAIGSYAAVAVGAEGVVGAVLSGSIAATFNSAGTGAEANLESLGGEASACH